MPPENPYAAKYYEPVIATLKKARELIAEYENWTVDAAARNANGTKCEVTDEDAVQFCALGAYYRAIHELPDSECVSSVRKICQNRLENASFKLYSTPYVRLNDARAVRTEEIHKKILRVYDEAIRELESNQ